MGILDKVPGIITKATGKLVFKPAVYSGVGAPSGPSYDPTPGTSQDYTCKALVDNWSSYSQSGGLVSAKDRKILILSTTLATRPEEGGRITIAGETFSIVSDGGSAPAVATDPAGAVWVCRGRA